MSNTYIELIDRMTSKLSKEDLHSYAIRLFDKKIVRMQEGFSLSSNTFQTLEQILIETWLHNNLDSIDLTELRINDIDYLKAFNKKVLEIDPWFDFEIQNNQDSHNNLLLL